MAEDLPPPLEDCTELLQTRQNAENPYLLNDDLYKESAITNDKKCKSKKKKKSKNAFNSGFLLSNHKNNGKKSKKKNKKKTEKLEMKSKGNSLIIPEAQKKLNNTQEAKMGKMAEKLHENKDVWNAMLSPEFGQAMNDLATNPHEALRKYQNDSKIFPTLTKVVETMYGKSLTTISKDIHSEIKRQQNAQKSDNQQLYDSLRIFNS
eukprot:CAMPEP_0201581432 /NCGR_PEP_ID=MMETSP0190_2-20130828/68102_1 /ASSEMBLY_ACC=CAM_ASM_000263 /TAXON_ID=37353 /ORGANISM="Rosalina sp." /LENGTH=205 /DNA_ID=CAMNT_0048019345 /DNA_START=19 /DNA_END=636 /DNA_ORIENTATION=+